ADVAVVRRVFSAGGGGVARRRGRGEPSHLRRRGAALPLGGGRHERAAGGTHLLGGHDRLRRGDAGGKLVGRELEEGVSKAVLRFVGGPVPPKLFLYGMTSH